MHPVPIKIPDDVPTQTSRQHPPLGVLPPPRGSATAGARREVAAATHGTQSQTHRDKTNIARAPRGHPAETPRVADHPWGCHRRRIPNRVVFDHVLAALVHGSGYEHIGHPRVFGSHDPPPTGRVGRTRRGCGTAQSRARRLRPDDRSGPRRPLIGWVDHQIALRRRTFRVDPRSIAVSKAPNARWSPTGAASPLPSSPPAPTGTTHPCSNPPCARSRT